jgi:hypothetical protein
MAGSLISAVAQPLIGSAVSSIFGGQQNSGGAAAAAASDPFASQRGGYQAQLAQLMSNPNSFQMSAGAQFAENQGLNAESAQMASRGLSGSGAEQLALTQYATGFAGQQYQQQEQDLAQLAGANTGDPGAAGKQIASGATTANSNLNTFAGNIGSAITGSNAFSSWLNGGSGAAASAIDVSSTMA